jgi:hypothetical protein
MPFDSLQIAQSSGAAGPLGLLAASDGIAVHRWLGTLARNPDPVRDLADAAHYLCLLHATHPGVIDHAVLQAATGIERDWLESAARAFAAERDYLVRIAAAAGPVPSTPGQAECEAAAQQQRHALETLARSDRAGCATGAALALALDWGAIRDLLDTGADRLGLAVPPRALPPAEETATVIGTLIANDRIERAMLFGAQQLFAQHRGLFDLLEARAGARAAI